MTLVNAYCTTDEVRGQFADGAEKLDIALLERAINAASRAVDTYCDRKFWQEAATSTRMYAPEHPIKLRIDDISVRAGLVVKVGSDGVNFPTILDATQFELWPRNADVVGAGSTARPFAFWRINRLSGRWDISGRPTVQVTARFGWSAVPYEVNEATILKAAALFKRKDAPFGVAGFGEFGAVRISRNGPHVADLLSAYAPILAR